VLPLRCGSCCNRSGSRGRREGEIIRKYEGTRLGRQELEAELLEDTPGALWSHGSIEASRLRSAPEMTRVVVAIDPAVTSGEEADELDHQYRIDRRTTDLGVVRRELRIDPGQIQ
jgi:hypothetical protein